MTELVVFCLDELRIALRLTAVERVVRAVQVTRLPQAPEIVLGVINLQGRAIPIVDFRNRFHLGRREPRITDQMIIARTARRPVGLMADAVDPECPRDFGHATLEITPSLAREMQPEVPRHEGAQFGQQRL